MDEIDLGYAKITPKDERHAEILKREAPLNSLLYKIAAGDIIGLVELGAILLDISNEKEMKELGEMLKVNNVFRLVISHRHISDFSVVEELLAQFLFVLKDCRKVEHIEIYLAGINADIFARVRSLVDFSRHHSHIKSLDIKCNEDEITPDAKAMMEEMEKRLSDVDDVKMEVKGVKTEIKEVDQRVLH